MSTLISSTTETNDHARMPATPSSEVPPSEAPSPMISASKAFRWGRWTMLVVALVAGILLLAEVVRVLLGSNFHTIIPGHAYRGALQSPEGLEQITREYGIRTVINLRGLCNGAPWYVEQCRMVQKLGITQEDICFSASRLPPPQELRRLIEVFDRAEAPFFLHCRRGADRTGIAGVTLMLLQEGIPYAEARSELSMRFAHIAVGKTAYLDEFLGFYESWLASEHRQHSPAAFRHWACEVYQGGWMQYRVEAFERIDKHGKKCANNTPIKTRTPIAYRLRVLNTGMKAWHFEPYKKSGYHVVFRIQDEQGQGLLEDRAALFEGDVPPGHHLDTVLVVPPVLRPGRYLLVVDLIQEHHAWFYQVGSEPLEEELVICE